MASRKKNKKKKEIKVRYPVAPPSKTMPDPRKEADRKACREPVEPDKE